MDPVSVRFQYGNYEAKLETGRIASTSGAYSQVWEILSFYVQL